MDQVMGFEKDNKFNLLKKEVEEFCQQSKNLNSKNSKKSSILFMRHNQFMKPFYRR